MNKNIISLLSLGLVLVGCGQQTQKESQQEFVDNVKLALADSGRVDLNNLHWTREPAGFEIKGDTIVVTTAPHTDLWQRTYYHFRKTREKFFSFVVKTDFSQSHQRFDQCGIVMYLDSENWLKGSVEYENDEFQHLGSVATNNGYSDRATTNPIICYFTACTFSGSRRIIATERQHAGPSPKLRAKSAEFPSQNLKIPLTFPVMCAHFRSKTVLES